MPNRSISCFEQRNRRRPVCTLLMDKSVSVSPNTKPASEPAIPLRFYRYRSVDALIDKWQELEKQEIYFSALDELNDPTEGFKDMFWRGDHIVWRNLLKHYLLCLMKAISIVVVGGKGFQITEGVIIGTLPNAPIKKTYERICSEFFASFDLERLPILIAECNYAFRRDDLEFILRSIHGFAVTLIFRTFREVGMLPLAPSAVPNDDAAEVPIESLKRTLIHFAAEKDCADEKSLRVLFSLNSHVLEQAMLVRYLSDASDASRAWHPVLYLFPEQYLAKIGYLVFPDWYAACFVADPTRAAMWGTYADQHKGVCLQFRAETNAQGRPMLKLRGLTGASGSDKGIVMNYGDRALTFDKITYVKRFDSLDFFRMMGKLPIPRLRSEWYTDAEGNTSVCAAEVFGTEEQWRKQYLKSFTKGMGAKSTDWRHEDEYRLTLTSALDLFSEKKDRKLTYRFSDLEGIVFGIRTSLEDKERIINIIGAKCKAEGRKDFTFSQAIYAAYSGKLEIRPMELLRFA